MTTAIVTKSQILSKICKMIDEQIRIYIDDRIVLVRSGQISGERLDGIKLEAKFAAEILLKRRR